MKKSILLASGLTVTLLFSGCGKVVITPDSRSYTAILSAEETADFYLSRDGEFHWSRQFASTEQGYTPCSLHFDGKQVTVVPGEKEDNTPTVHFAPALAEDATIQISNAGGETVFSASVAAGATEFSLAELVVAQTGVYSFDVYLTAAPNLSRNVPRYIVKADGIVYDRHN